MEVWNGKAQGRENIQKTDERRHGMDTLLIEAADLYTWLLRIGFHHKTESNVLESTWFLVVSFATGVLKIVSICSLDAPWSNNGGLSSSPNLGKGEFLGSMSTRIDQPWMRE